MRMLFCSARIPIKTAVVVSFRMVPFRFAFQDSHQSQGRWVFSPGCHNGGDQWCSTQSIDDVQSKTIIFQYHFNDGNFWFFQHHHTVQGCSTFAIQHTHRVGVPIQHGFDQFVRTVQQTKQVQRQGTRGGRVLYQSRMAFFHQTQQRQTDATPHTRGGEQDMKRRMSIDVSLLHQTGVKG